MMTADFIYSKPRISRIQVDRQIYLSYAKIRLMRSEIKGFGTIVRDILSEIWESDLCDVHCINIGRLPVSFIKCPARLIE